jgi:galactose mutarotase-like enzyme
MSRLQNEFLTIEVKTTGAELSRLRTADGTEHLWQADPTFWERHAPILFPIVAALRDNRYEWMGRTYRLPPHGFARDLEFTQTEQTSDTLTFQLLPTAETRAAYPFEFALDLTYKLHRNSVEMHWQVHNQGDNVMPFSIGAHPAFNLPGAIDDFFLEFEKIEPAPPRLLENNLVSEQTVAVLQNSNRLPLSRSLFDRGALIFLNPASQKVHLGSRRTTRRLTVEFAGFPQLGIWSKPGAPFVCIEPWYGYPDPEHPYGDIRNKPGILKLPAGETFTCEHRVIVQP